MLGELATDDELLERAERLTGIKDRTDVIREALTALIERESARKLAQLAASEPELRDIPRRRIDPA